MRKGNRDPERTVNVAEKSGKDRSHGTGMRVGRGHTGGTPRVPMGWGGQAIGSRESPEGLQDRAVPPCCLWQRKRRLGETTVHSPVTM